MRLFDAVREEATAYDIAVNYGLRPNRAKMICCPFHQDKHPSMKVDKRYYCFGCGAHGDAIDFVAKLYGIGMKEAAIKIATDFHIFYDDKMPTSFEQKNYEMKKSKARKWAEDKRELCQRISKLHSYLREMKIEYAPKSIEDSDWSPLFKLAVDDFETIVYYYELFILESTDEEQKKIYEELKKEIENIERRHFNYRSTEDEQRGAEKRAV
mgnify:CR=1 FL=1